MKHDLFITRSIVIASLMVLPLILPIGSSAAEPDKGTRALQDKALKSNAVESVQDSLKACLGRIPLDASIGQLMLAKENCQTVAAGRVKTFLTF
ncbi:MAG: hypothetical protein OEY91_05565 [Nitrospirota bacterium]|nr:hypothetical protein [Nitrospirota bacterium]